MKQRLNYAQLSAPQMTKLMELSQVKSSLAPGLKNLVDIRASQINGCTFCLDMHVKEAKLRGERELRVHHVAVWRESNLFSEKERAVLELTELVTSLDPKGLSDADYGRLSGHLSEQEMSDVVFKISIINIWNRLNVIFRNEPGSLDKMFGLDKADM